ncbi:MAG: hypothetical protein KGQ59_04875 [Bdellovibrionales bacterium]|nr:hypothetical protein [Bdellovibrionales bacterium]
MATLRDYQPDMARKETAPESSESQGEKPIAIDGFQQVVDMLMAADPAFRESLLARLARRDPRLVKSLREQIL